VRRERVPRAARPDETAALATLDEQLWLRPHDVLVTTILYDDDICSRLEARDAVRWMGEAIDAHYRGDLVAPPRVHADIGDGRIVFTTGRLRGSWFGYRSYDTFPAKPGSQVVVVHDEHSGEVRAIAIGNELGPRRTGGDRWSFL